MGKRGILRVTPRFWGKRGCRGSVRSCFRFLGDDIGLRLLRYAALWANVGSCVLRHGSGESVAVVPRFSGWRACLANCRRPGLLASRPLAGMTLCLLREIGLADDVLVDEQDIPAPVPLLPDSYKIHLFAVLCHQVFTHRVWSRRSPRLWHRPPCSIGCQRPISIYPLVKYEKSDNIRSVSFKEFDMSPT